MYACINVEYFLYKVLDLFEFAKVLRTDFTNKIFTL